MATRSVYYGNWQLALYSAGVLIGTIAYPDNSQGPVESPAHQKFAEAWKSGQTIKDLQTKFPNVNYRPNR